ncbi:MAG TPA: hypothetical protein VMW50_09965 [Dehalococcoidia bacterium]|nr:hypothetical protein [Dehalococcoidia bacterium]
MKGKLIGLLLIGVLLLAGCSQVTPITPYIPPADNAPVNGQPPVDRTWISPAKVQVGNFYPGARAEWELSVHNGNDATAEFAVVYREPSYTAGGYAGPPAGAKEWVIVADSSPVLMPYETRDILIALDVPVTAVITADKWEFWISVKDITQGGSIQTELCSRWLVVMQ